MCEYVRLHGKGCAWNQVANQLTLRQGDYPSPTIRASPVQSEASVKNGGGSRGRKLWHEKDAS